MSFSKGTWDEFNYSARSLGHRILVPGTYILRNSEANIVVPWKGEWTLSMDEKVNELTLSTTTPNPGSYEFYIRGDMNDWTVSDDWKFELVEGYQYILRNVTIKAGQYFKIADAQYGTIDFGGTQNMNPGAEYVLNNEFGNSSLAVDFTGDVHFNLYDCKVRFGDKEAKRLCVIGDFCNWNFELAKQMDRVGDSNVYTCRFENGLTGNFKVSDGTWNYNFGSSDGSGNVNCTEGENDAKFNGFNWKVDNITYPVVLTFTLVEGSDVENSDELSSLVLSNGETDGVEDIATDNSVSVQYYNLQGVPVANPEKGLYIVNKGGKVYKTLVR